MNIVKVSGVIEHCCEEKDKDSHDVSLIDIMHEVIRNFIFIKTYVSTKIQVFTWK